MPDVSSSDDVGKRLTRFLESQSKGETFTVTSVSPLSGGYSRTTHRADVQWRDRGTQHLLLRADPAESSVFESNRDDEWDLLMALNKVSEISIPEPLWYDQDGKYFDSKCMVIQFHDGTSLKSEIECGYDLDQATILFADIAAAIHCIPLDALPKTMPRPTDWNSYLDSVIEIFDRTEHNIVENVPAVRYVHAWLRHHRPEPVPLTLVHGDLQPTNLLLTPNKPPLLIDWEFGRIGDPREDLGYFFQFPMPPNLIRRNPELLLARYREVTGLTKVQVNVETIQYFLMIGMARLLEQILTAVDSLDQSGEGGAITTYLINAISYQCNEYLNIVRNSAVGVK